MKDNNKYLIFMSDITGLQAFEMMAIAAVRNNLITCVFNEMSFRLSKSANIVTNFIGTVFLLSLFAGFISDSYFGSFLTILILALWSSGFILLSVQAHLQQLRPPKCSMLDNSFCAEANGYKAMIFFLSLYLVALGSSEPPSAAVMVVGLISLISGNSGYRNKPPEGSIFTPIA
ncbi:hypothetical protein L6164_023601 [Bauhinia variegata]|uniref:Uncharacterized protein n=1 Tax=Bauhinia variegata TaxID=167791 RepID=A0ACB9MK37_BAUVA|nr:hypothetical protein L6164_023601 [Bauhinia variegata]